MSGIIAESAQLCLGRWKSGIIIGIAISSLAAMAEHPIFRHQKIVSDPDVLPRSVQQLYSLPNISAAQCAAIFSCRRRNRSWSFWRRGGELNLRLRRPGGPGGTTYVGWPVCRSVNSGFPCVERHSSIFLSRQDPPSGGSAGIMQ